MKKRYGLFLAGLAVAALPIGSAGAGTLGFMPSGNWAQKIPNSELKEMRGAGPGIAFDIAISGSIENLSEFTGVSATTPPPGFDLTVSNGLASITTIIGGINGNGIFIFNQVPGSLNVLNTTVVVNIAINGLVP